MSLRALTVLHQRHPQPGSSGGADVVFLAQLSFAQHSRKPPRVLQPALDPATWLDAPICNDPLLCAWMSAAERATLVSWGVPP